MNQLVMRYSGVFQTMQNGQTCGADMPECAGTIDVGEPGFWQTVDVVESLSKLRTGINQPGPLSSAPLTRSPVMTKSNHCAVQLKQLKAIKETTHV